VSHKKNYRYIISLDAAYIEPFNDQSFETEQEAIEFFENSKSEYGRVFVHKVVCNSKHEDLAEIVANRTINDINDSYWDILDSYHFYDVGGPEAVANYKKALERLKQILKPWVEEFVDFHAFNYSDVIETFELTFEPKTFEGLSFGEWLSHRKLPFPNSYSQLDVLHNQYTHETESL
jgi:hypothetical protein